MSENPFSGPFGGAPNIGGNPLEDDGNAKICCPACKSENFRGWTTQYGVMRKCNEPNCQTEWSGGTVAAGRSNFLDLFPQPMPGSPAPDDDQPIGLQYYGSGFRDPSKNFDDDY